MKMVNVILYKYTPKQIGQTLHLAIPVIISARISVHESNYLSVPLVFLKSEQGGS
jgi:hypothetical protein